MEVDNLILLAPIAELVKPFLNFPVQ